ncbi:hypothetical protein ID866_12193 [Astraeus odoratus]|nr:hypothetical protein ID866_12193 [Astraeus odoratus]
MFLLPLSMIKHLNGSNNTCKEMLLSAMHSRRLKKSSILQTLPTKKMSGQNWWRSS